MSELEDLLALYGAIDRAVVDRPELAEMVAPYLRPYEPSPDGESAAGWFEEFTTWTAERLGREAIARLGSPSDALASLAETDPSDPLHGKRLVAIAVLARLRGGLADEDAVGEAELSAALSAGDAGDDLLRLLLDDDAFGSLADWQGLLHRANAEGHLSDIAALARNEPLLCSAKLVPVRVRGTAMLAATLTTAFCIDKSEITFEQATRFLDPTTWPACNGLWCSMEETGSSWRGNPVFHEVVSLNCGADTRSWTAEACLEFKSFTGPGLQGVSYDLCEGHPKPGAMILVDQGSLKVKDGVDEICIETTKRIRFSHPFNGSGLTMVMCTLGYGHVSEDLVRCAARRPPSVPRTPRKSPTKTPKPPPASGANPVDDVVAAAAKCLDECGAAVTASYDKAMAGTYGADDLVGDMAKMWARMLRDSAVALDLGMRAVRPIGGYMRGAATSNQDQGAGQ